MMSCEWTVRGVVDDVGTDLHFSIEVGDRLGRPLRPLPSSTSTASTSSATATGSGERGGKRMPRMSVGSLGRPYERPASLPGGGTNLGAALSAGAAAGATREASEAGGAGRDGSRMISIFMGRSVVADDGRVVGDGGRVRESRVCISWLSTAARESKQAKRRTARGVRSRESAAQLQGTWLEVWSLVATLEAFFDG